MFSGYSTVDFYTNALADSPTARLVTEVCVSVIKLFNVDSNTKTETETGGLS